MWFVYILKSVIAKKFYTGKTNDLKRRLGEHDTGRSKYTKRFVPWEMIYKEEFPTEDEAVRREKYFKSASGRRWLKKNIRF